MHCQCCPDMPYVTKSERSMRRHKEKMRKQGVNIPKGKPGRLCRGFAFKKSAEEFKYRNTLAKLFKVHKAKNGCPDPVEAEDYATDQETVNRVQSVMLKDLTETVTIVNREDEEWLLFEAPVIPETASDELLALIAARNGGRQIVA